MPYNKTSSSLELNLATKFETCKIMFKSSLTTSLIAGILSLPGLGKVSQAQALPNTSRQYDRVTSPVPVRVANKEPNSDRQTVAEEDPYITKLKAEIEQLRNQKPRLSQGSKNTSASKNLKSPGENPPSTRKNAPAKIETVSVVNSVPASDFQASLLPEDSIALQLPPLPPDEYLPSTFDGYIWPTQGILTSGYGWRWGRMHRGIDIAAPIGTPIVAAASGEVINVGWQSGYGNVIKLKHLDGSVTVYGHNHKNLVTHGQKVEQGEQIAEMGNTGRSTGSHLHFEIRLADEVAVDPLGLLDNRSIANND